MSLISLALKAVRKYRTDGIIPLVSEIIPDKIYKTYVAYVKPYLRLCRYRLKGYSAISRPDKRICISPTAVRRQASPSVIEDRPSKFGKWESVGLILDGRWDIKARKLQKMEKYCAVYDRFLNGTSWEDTGIITHLQNRIIKEGRPMDGCRNKEELEKRYNQIDRLFDDLKRYGYQAEKHSTWDSVSVHIARDGELLFAGSGAHRLFICQIVGIENIPVWVKVRHKEWQHIREEVKAAQSPTELSEEAKKNIRHPDLHNLVNDDWIK
jgi:hypothetical protein